MSQRECVLDVGSGSVGLCVFDRSREKPLLISTSRTQISAGTEEAKASITERTITAISKALEPHHKTSAPAHVRVVLASPWYDAKIKTITTKSERSVRVTPETIVRTMKQYLAQKNEPLPAGRTQIESIVSQAYVNGYPTNLKEPLIGTVLRVNYYSSEADTEFVRQVTIAIHAVFPNSKVTFHSFAYVGFTALRMVRDEENFVLMDIGGEITDIGVVHHDGFRFIGTFPVGTQSLVRAVAGEGSLPDTATRLSLFANDELSPEEHAQIAQKLATASEGFKTQLRTSLEAASVEVAVPQTTFLFADPQQLRWLDSIVSMSHGPFSIRATLISPDFFQPLVSVEEEAFYDSFLCAAALYFHRGAQSVLEVH